MRDLLTIFSTAVAGSNLSSVLVLNQYEQTNQPVKVDNLGNTESSGFTLGEGTEVYGACSVQYNDQFYIIGGFDEPRQVSTVDGCSLNRVGSLPFDHKFGACATLSQNRVLLCFDSTFGTNHMRDCYVSNDGPLGTFEAIQQSIYDHRGIRMAATSNKALAVGSVWPSHAQAELLDTDTMTWSAVPDYPFETDIAEAAVTALGDDFYVFGGASINDYGLPVTLSSIAKFDTTSLTWSKIGRMREPRQGHSLIQMNNEIWVLGGMGRTRIEKCALVNENMACVATRGQLANFEFYPEAFAVEDNFCSV